MRTKRNTFYYRKLNEVAKGNAFTTTSRSESGVGVGMSRHSAINDLIDKIITANMEAFIEKGFDPNTIKFQIELLQ